MSAITQRLRDLRRGLSGRREARTATRAERQLRREDARKHHTDLKRVKGHADGGGGGDFGGGGM